MTGDGHSWCGLGWESDSHFSLPYLCFQPPSAFPSAQQRPSTRVTPLSTLSSLMQQTPAKSVVGSSWFMSATLFPLREVPLCSPLSPAAPLLPCWQQQQGFQGGLARLDPWGSRGAPSSCCLS